MIEVCVHMCLCVCACPSETKSKQCCWVVWYWRKCPISFWGGRQRLKEGWGRSMQETRWRVGLCHYCNTHPEPRLSVCLSACLPVCLSFSVVDRAGCPLITGLVVQSFLLSAVDKAAIYQPMFAILYSPVHWMVEFKVLSLVMSTSDEQQRNTQSFYSKTNENKLYV